MSMLLDSLKIDKEVRVALSRVTTIVTHPGDAHRDEFMAIAFLLAVISELGPAKKLPRVFRRNILAADNNYTTMWIDTGGECDPSKLHFDHHHFTSGPPTCALSLVLSWLGIYETAKVYLPWLEFTEVLDCKGPVAAAASVGIKVVDFQRTASPIEAAVLLNFQSSQEPDLAVALNIGSRYLQYLSKLTVRQEVLAKCPMVTVAGLPVLDTREIPREEEPTLGIEAYLRLHCLNPAVIVGNDERGPGYSLYRRNDHPRVDFRWIKDHDKVSFVHAGGFLAKTVALCNPFELVNLAIAAPPLQPFAGPPDEPDFPTTGYRG